MNPIIFSNKISNESCDLDWLDVSYHQEHLQINFIS